MEQQRTHLDRIKELYTIEEILEINDLDEEQLIQILYDLGYLLYPEDRVDIIKGEIDGSNIAR